MSRRANNEGSVYRDKSRGDWIAAVTYEGADGKRRRRRRRASTQRDAQRLRRQMVQELGERGTLKGERDQTLSTYLDSWLNDVVIPTLRPKTAEGYGYAVRRLIAPAIGHVPLKRLTAQHVQHLLNAVQADALAPATAAKARRVLHRALAQAIEWDLIDSNPVANVRGPRQSQKEQPILLPEQATALLAQVSGHRLSGLYTLALGLGLRRGELLGATWEDVDLEAGTLSVRQQLVQLDRRVELSEPKTERSRRTLALPRFCVAALREHRQRQIAERLQLGPAWQDHNLVFCSSVGTPLSPRNLVRHFKRQLVGADLPDIPFHSLRHSAASFLAQQGVHQRTAMEILGHSTTTMTMQIYTHVIEEQKREAAAQIDALLGS